MYIYIYGYVYSYVCQLSLDACGGLLTFGLTYVLYFTSARSIVTSCGLLLAIRTFQLTNFQTHVLAFQGLDATRSAHIDIRLGI